MIRAIYHQVLGGTILHVMVTGSYSLFQLVRLADKRFVEAIKDFEAAYQFKAGTRGQYLVFSRGRIRTGLGVVQSPDYELVLQDPPGVVKKLVNNPDDMIKLLMENKIDQRGNNYFLFKFGYLLGLCRRYFQETGEKIKPEFLRRK